METETQTDPTGNRKMDAREFARYELRMNPDLQYDALKAKAAMEGIVVHPIVFGRVRRELGLAPALPPRRERQPEAATARPGPMAMPAPARPPEQTGAAASAYTAPGAPAATVSASPSQQGTPPWMHAASSPAPATAAPARQNVGVAAAALSAAAPTTSPMAPHATLAKTQPSLLAAAAVAKQPVSPGDDLQQLVRLVREAAEEQQRMRAALERIRGILDAALDD